MSHDLFRPYPRLLGYVVLLYALISPMALLNIPFGWHSGEDDLPWAAFVEVALGPAYLLAALSLLWGKMWGRWTVRVVTAADLLVIGIYRLYPLVTAGQRPSPLEIPLLVPQVLPRQAS